MIMKNLFLTAFTALISLAVSAQRSVNYKSPEQQLNDAYCTGLFKTTDGTVLDVASNTSARSYFNILDWLEGRVAGLQVYTSRTGQSIPVIRGNIPGIYVDEMLVSASYLNALSINDIAIVKIIKTPFYGGFNGAGGAIAIYTLRAEEEEEEAGDTK
jgi:hypothetical protein